MNLCERQTPENIENVPLTHGHSFEQLPLSRYYPSVQPLYESLVNRRSGRSVVFQKPGWSFPSVPGLQTCISSFSETSIFATKFHQFSVSWNRLRVCKWRRPYATWRLHIKTVPSHNIFELFNPDGFSNYAFVRAPDAREHRKATIDAEPFV